ncbi:hypothetical protein [Microcoleus sp. herbarium14]|uniref:hypothetical protein n=1 Tax=Microcoleus sp. herbarium14 TaxID=3055439 RepID=UPI002FD23270
MFAKEYMWSVIGLVDSTESAESKHLAIISGHLINLRKMPLIPIIEAMIKSRWEELGFKSEIDIDGEVKEVLLTISDSYLESLPQSLSK